MTTMQKATRGTLVALTTILAGCSSVTTNFDDVVFEVIEDTTFDPSLEINLADFTRLESGVYVLDVVEGDGAEATASSRLEVQYAGWLTNGFLFDAGQFSFLAGTQEVIPGFELGVLGMKVGGQRRIIIPPALGYGAFGQGSIPGGAVLVFEVELRNVT